MCWHVAAKRAGSTSLTKPTHPCVATPTSHVLSLILFQITLSYCKLIIMHSRYPCNISYLDYKDECYRRRGRGVVSPFR